MYHYLIGGFRLIECLSSHPLLPLPPTSFSLLRWDPTTLRTNYVVSPSSQVILTDRFSSKILYYEAYQRLVMITLTIPMQRIPYNSHDSQLICRTENWPKLIQNINLRYDAWKWQCVLVSRIAWNTTSSFTCCLSSNLSDEAGSFGRWPEIPHPSTWPA